MKRKLLFLFTYSANNVSGNTGKNTEYMLYYFLNDNDNRYHYHKHYIKGRILLMKNLQKILVALTIVLSIVGCTGENEKNNVNEVASNEAKQKDSINKTTESDDDSTRLDNHLDNNNEKTIQITDCAGRKVEIEGTAERIVDLTMIEGVRTLIQLGAQDRLVGMSQYDHQAFNPDGLFKKTYFIVSRFKSEMEKITNVGSHTEPNIEMVLSLEPDVVFVEYNRKEYADVLQKQIDIPVVCVGGYGSFNYEVFSIVGEIVGKEERAKELIAFAKEKIKLVTDITDKIKEEDKKSIYYWVRPLIDDPRTDAYYEAFELAGAINVASNAENISESMFKVTKEQILAWDADYIFMHSSFTEENVKGWHTIDSIKQDSIVKGTKAVIDNHVYPLRGPMRGWDIATQAAEVLYIAKLLYPDKFIDLDVEQNGNEILEKFYNINGLYTDMSQKVNLYEWK